MPNLRSNLRLIHHSSHRLTAGPRSATNRHRQRHPIWRRKTHWNRMSYQLILMMTENSMASSWKKIADCPHSHP
jgi:hypothetical protein